MSRADLEEATYSFPERFLLLVCQYQIFLYMALVVESMLLSLALLSWLVADLSPASATVLLIDFVLLGFALALTIGGLVACNRLGAGA